MWFLGCQLLQAKTLSSIGKLYSYQRRTYHLLSGFPHSSRASCGTSLPSHDVPDLGSPVASRDIPWPGTRHSSVRKSPERNYRAERQGTFRVCQESVPPFPSRISLIPDKILSTTHCVWREKLIQLKQVVCTIYPVLLNGYEIATQECHGSTGDRKCMYGRTQT